MSPNPDLTQFREKILPPLSPPSLSSFLGFSWLPLFSSSPTQHHRPFQGASKPLNRVPTLVTISRICLYHFLSLAHQMTIMYVFSCGSHPFKEPQSFDWIVLTICSQPPFFSKLPVFRSLRRLFSVFLHKLSLALNLTLICGGSPPHCRVSHCVYTLQITHQQIVFCRISIFWYYRFMFVSFADIFSTLVPFLFILSNIHFCRIPSPLFSGWDPVHINSGR